MYLRAEINSQWQIAEFTRIQTAAATRQRGEKYREIKTKKVNWIS
jgi:hypothetical protein